MKIDGACHCGAIKYEAEIDPEAVRLCHCSDCQNFSGGAFRTVVLVSEDNLTVLSGAPKEYVKIGDSGNQRIQAFCGTCGAGFHSTSVGDGPKVYSLRLGTARQRNELVPKSQIWTRSAQAWLGDIDSIPKSEKA
ncbi:MAG: GFA family protein [Rhodospirillales bacterium]|nr:GFA family protein [Rhodospirillales bacterium]